MRVLPIQPALRARVGVSSPCNPHCHFMAGSMERSICCPLISINHPNDFMFIALTAGVRSDVAEVFAARLHARAMLQAFAKIADDFLNNNNRMTI